MYQVIIIRSDLKMRCGKKIAQGAHASVKAALRAEKSIYYAWDNDGHKKVSLRISGREALVNLYKKALELDLPCSLIWDIGLTQIEPSYTAVAIGPCKDEVLQKLTKELKLI